MDFTFSEDQLLLRDSVRDFLRNEITPAVIRAGWESETGRDPAIWQQIVDMGLPGMTVSEEYGGLGMSELDFVLLAQECGYVALPNPLVHTALVAVPLLTAIGGDLAANWLPKIAAGEALVVVGLEQNELLEDAHQADLILIERSSALYALTPEQCTLRHNESIDPSRKLYAVEFDADIRPLREGSAAQDLVAAALNRGALACAAQALGLTQRMVDMTVEYTGQRQQFGKPIGSFQAIKHHMANVAVGLEYAKAPVYKAAYSIAKGEACAAQNVSQLLAVKLSALPLCSRQGAGSRLSGLSSGRPGRTRHGLAGNLRLRS